MINDISENTLTLAQRPTRDASAQKAFEMIGVPAATES